MRFLNIEEVFRYIRAQGRPVEFAELLIYFGAETKHDRHSIRSKCCRLVKQCYLIKLDADHYQAATV